MAHCKVLSKQNAMIYIHATILLLVLTIPHQTIAAFTISPSAQIVGVGLQAVFRCQNLNADFIAWMVNETRVTLNMPHPDPNIRVDTTRDENNNVINLLNIAAQSKYNETVIVCVAGSIGSNDTAPVKLLIQGPLNMVTEIKKRSSTITWMPPFSLNLTGIDPNIVYCVEVYNITCGVDDLVVGDCNVTEPRFLDNSLQQGYIYRITITPRSNGQEAQNGTSNTIEEMFTGLNDSRIIIMFINSSMVTASFQFRNESTGVEPDFYSITITAIDEIEELNSDILATNFERDTSSTNVSVIEPLPRRRLWNYQILALDCNEHPITSVLELSTHDFQIVTVSSPSPGLIRVTGDFINGSSATSVLIIIYSTDNVYYTISSTEGETLVTNISSLPSGPYNVSVFVLEENGRPFNRSASTPRNVLVKEHQGDEIGIEYEVKSTSTGVCITCTFLDSSTTDCVAVVHQQISQLSSSRLMNIESSYKFNRSGDTAYGCIEGVNLTEYQIGVIDSHRSMKKTTPNISTDCNWCIQVGIFIAGVVLGIILTLIPMIIIIIFIKKRAHVDASKEERIEMQNCGAYEVTKPLRQPQPRSLDMDDNPAYGVHQQ